MVLSVFLNQLQQLGIRLWAENGELCFKTPNGALTEALRAELTIRKAEILQLLQGSPVKPPFEVPPSKIPESCGIIEPGMLTLVDVSPADIGQIVSTVPDGTANVRDVYPLDPRGLFFNNLRQVTSQITRKTVGVDEK